MQTRHLAEMVESSRSGSLLIQRFQCSVVSAILVLVFAMADSSTCGGHVMIRLVQEKNQFRETSWNQFSVVSQFADVLRVGIPLDPRHAEKRGDNSASRQVGFEAACGAQA